MKKQIKHVLESRASFLLNIYRTINNRRIFRKRFSLLHSKMRRHLYGDKKITVLSGPFQGLCYLDEIVWGPITPKWLGSYEIELNEVIEEIATRNYENVIDIGCAEGYYAIGLAYRLPLATIYAYDTDFISRHQTRKLARINCVQGRVHVLRYCSCKEITQRASACTLIICDIEGFERSLLDPITCPSLLNIDILVEVHEKDWLPSTLQLLKGRFSNTHLVTEVTSESRDKWLEAFESVIPNMIIDQKLLHEAVDECRSNGQKWLWMKMKEAYHRDTPNADKPPS